MNKQLRIPSRITGGVNRLTPHYFIESEPSDQVDYHSYLGTPVYSPLEFLNTDESVVLRLDNVLLAVELRKNVVKTHIPGRKGTIKEYVGEDDFRITVSGLIVSPYPNVYPGEEVKTLEELIRKQSPIDVASEFLQMFGIDSIVIEHASISQAEGSRNTVPFEIYALSDNPIETKLKNH